MLLLGIQLRRTAFAALMLAGSLRAQTGAAVGFLDVGSERERYLRILQITGGTSLYPLTIRALAPSELDRMALRAPGPWFFQELSAGSWNGVNWQVLPVQSSIFYNSAFPYGINDGPVWAGRGATVAAQAGVALRVGPLSVQAEPMIFDAQNQAFALMPSNRVGNTVYANEFFPTSIDLPQRFGSSHYARIDPGQTTVRLEGGPVAAAFSTANQFWGPALENPIVLGDNAAGFPNVFVGTSHPVNVGIGFVHARVVWGELDQTGYSPKVGLGSRRLMTGIAGVFLPRGIPGLELGATRFSHTPWTGRLDGALLLKPFGGLSAIQPTHAQDSTGALADNQLASIYFRWALPQSGAEFYGEYGRDDHWVDVHDLSEEPDHEAAYLLGLQRAWRKGPASLTVVRAEVLNSRISHLAAGRGQAPWYTHSGLTQGHTESGQLLASASGYGGGAALIAVDRYGPSGRWTVRVSRSMRAQWDQSSPLLGPNGNGVPDPSQADVMYTVGIERLALLPKLEITTTANGIWDLHRDFQRDQFDLNLVTSLRFRR